MTSLCTAITSVETPAIADVEYEYGSRADPIVYKGFESEGGGACDYAWSYSATLADGTELDADFIKFDPDTLTFTVEAATGEAQTMEVLLKGELSDEETTAEIQFKV